MPDGLLKIFQEFKKVGRGLKKLRFFQFTDITWFWKIISRKEKILLYSLVALLIVDLCIIGIHSYHSHTTPVPTSGGTYSEGEVGQPRFINPLLAQSQTDKDLVRLVFAGLYKYDDHGNLIPDLATGSVQISKDQKKFTVALQPNLKWHDGKDLNADDVIFTIQTLQNTDYKSPLQKNWQNTTVKKIDNLTIQFTNADVSAPFINNLTLGILPAHIWANITPTQFATSTYNLEPVGSGPYFAKQLSKKVSGLVESYLFQANPNYWGGKPLIQNFNIKFYNQADDAVLALHGRDIDGFGFVSFNDKIYVDKNKTNLQIKQLPVFAYQALFFNTGRGGSTVLGDGAVRMALSKSIDRNAFVSDVYGGLTTPITGPIMPEQLGYDPSAQTISAYDLVQANQILDRDGWHLDSKTNIRTKGKSQLHFTITTNDFVLNQKSAEDLKAQWQKVGADVAVNIVPTADLENNYIRTRNFDALLFAESTGFDPDPFVFWHSSQILNPGLNIGQYTNVKADKLINDARNTFNTSARAQKYSDFQKILLTDAPAVFLAQSNFVYELSSKVQGLTITQLANPEDRFYDVEHWYTATKRIFK